VQDDVGEKLILQRNWYRCINNKKIRYSNIYSLTQLYLMERMESGLLRVGLHSTVDFVPLIRVSLGFT